MSVEMSREAFEELVADALDEIPEEFWARLDNVVFIVEDEPGEDMEPDLLGLYDGVALTERGDYAGVLPDRILIFKGPLERWCSSREELVDEVGVTVLHEVAHHFGIDDARLHDLGWD